MNGSVSVLQSVAARATGGAVIRNRKPARGAVRFASVLLAGLFMVPAHNAHTQQRSIWWPSVEVQARLESDGTLRVRERQELVFNGDWNGGRRNFRVKSGQYFSLDSVVRIDSLDGVTRHTLTAGTTDVVHGYEINGYELRWRVKLPYDPPFVETHVVYELFYSYRNILNAGNDPDQFILDHDFAFSDRDGVIERFVLDIEPGSGWRGAAGFVGHYEASGLYPGRGFVVTVPFTRTAAEAPRYVRLGTPLITRLALAAAAVAAVLLLLARLWQHDRKAGRFIPLEPLSAVTPEFLEREIYSHLPEVIGTAWDDSVSQAEIAAIIARMSQEGKLATRVEDVGGLLTRTKDVLFLTLLVPVVTLTGYERELVDALFEPDSNETSTLAVRQRYKETGFDPSILVRSTLKELATTLTQTKGGNQKRPSAWLTAALLISAALLLALQFFRHGSDILSIAVLVGGGVILWGVAVIAAISWRKAVHRELGGGIFFVVVIVIMFGALFAVPFNNAVVRYEWPALAGLTLLAIAAVRSITNNARFAVPAAIAAKRRKLALARRWYKQQLTTAQPAMSDRAYPYLLAFGLGTQVDNWFRAFGGDEAGLSGGTFAVSRGGGSGGLADSGFSGFGGGAGLNSGFTGGGGGARFGAAIGGMTASVPSPGSSGSSGGGGGSSGGGSSGGGGGGGW